MWLICCRLQSLRAGQDEPGVVRQGTADEGPICRQLGRQPVRILACVAYSTRKRVRQGLARQPRAQNPSQHNAPSASCRSSCARPSRGPQRPSLPSLTPNSCLRRPLSLSLQHNGSTIAGAGDSQGLFRSLGNRGGPEPATTPCCNSKAGTTPRTRRVQHLKSPLLLWQSLLCAAAWTR